LLFHKDILIADKANDMLKTAIICEIYLDVV
jgi:hypothetical protein